MVQENYGIIVDSGSSGSRLQVYKWQDPNELRVNTDDESILKSVPRMEQEESWPMKVSPGMSSFADDMDDLWDDHFKPLIKHAQSIIPESKHEETPIFVYATAGMRLVSEKERNKMFKTVCKSIRKHSKFILNNCDDHVKLIDGETEGIYGWLGLNYLLRQFDNYYPDRHSHSSFGFMDMGGASTQIAFFPSNETEVERHSDDMFSVTLKNVNGDVQEWPVFVSSWLGFGANQARKRYLKSLAKTLVDDVDYDPDGDGIIQLNDVCSPRGLKLQEKYDGKVYQIQGTGDYASCMKSIYPLLLKHLPCQGYPCLFNGVHAPMIDFQRDKFVGISEYWYTANDVFQMGGEYNFMLFNEKVINFCSSSWEEIERNYKENLYGENINLELLQDSCFKASWVINVLHEGFGLPRIDLDENVSEDTLESNDQEFKHIPFQSANLIEGAELSWTLGAMLLFAASQINTGYSEAKQVGIKPSKTAANVAGKTFISPVPNSLFYQEDEFSGLGLHTLLLFLTLFVVLFFLVYFNKVSLMRFKHNGFVDSISSIFFRTYHFLQNKSAQLYHSKIRKEKNYFTEQEIDIQKAHLEEGLLSYSNARISSPNHLRTRPSLYNLQDISDINDNGKQVQNSSSSPNLYKNLVSSRSNISLPNLNTYNNTIRKSSSNLTDFKKYHQLAGSFTDLSDKEV
ncbi:Apyrase with wide substrate specificity [Komagataella phaffii CBS 7435]|uniref:Apyrase with wide substrate specificity n=2 Tax=Komagataella phaffii TaxID=460519 RepID=C4QVZ8_KOMPG|nr:Apyrase with wide substrate specificity [Komagataella phaffii GS115]AOA61831.1 GQ67_02626T0 [Komagataella phaffii]CAH2446085.1 Apyrase with wide substrate specificity [Komagataella phaffii CBS 7435]AOA65676.1 GQ68_02622T0 [Komagataella phaffii GS115]CAY67421.1 Apyrase with wide substrate specificity [Komagataella phaffii GS115]CCA36521.1 Apyrase with wide substrate specificity [Komagataella phaffii CBS 7435]